MFSYGGSRFLPPVNKQTENVKLSFHTARIWSFNGSYANRESGMEQAQRIPVPLQIEAQRSGFDLWTKTGGADMEL